MVFSSPAFLFLYLPIVLLVFMALPRALRTAFLVFASLLFYAWSESKVVLLLVVSIVLNWALALVLDRTEHPSRRRWLVVGAVALNMGALLIFKYTNFLVANLNTVLAAIHARPIVVETIPLPIGISFVTFEALSYVVDVYRRETRASKNPFHVGFYVSFFPHLIAGPIVRFRQIAGQVASPAPTLDGFASGVHRFVLGLGKKLLIANTVGARADMAFATAPAALTSGTAWLGVICYALQIYFDFSGYSDMAVGLGRMFGFQLPENFDLPYCSRSIRELWRRWHMSLSTWFRDYLYLPLGGSRSGTLGTYRNLLIVFLLCGFWHGASWTFVIWGAYHGGFLVLERLRFGQWLDRSPRPVQHVYTMLVVLVGWVFFRAETFTSAFTYLGAMAGLHRATAMPDLPTPVSREVVIAIAVGTVTSTLPLRRWLSRLPPMPKLEPLATSLTLGLFFLCALYLASSTYNPFIYFRF